MAINSLSTGFRPGVCTSSTRPTAPYTGQVIYETDTSLSYVYNGSSWQQVSGGTAVGNSGLVYITSATVVGTPTTLTIDNCFTSAYENYRVIVKYTNPGTGYPAVYVNWRAGGVSNTAASYAQMGNGRTSGNADASYGSSGNTNAYIGSIPGSLTFDVLSPQNANVQTTTLGQSNFYDGTSFTLRNTSSFHNVVAGYDGFVLSIASSTFTSNMTVRVYGYR